MRGRPGAPTAPKPKKPKQRKKKPKAAKPSAAALIQALVGGGLTQGQAKFAVLASKATGISVRVMGAWVLAEGGPDDNPLNIGPGNHYGSPEGAVKATVSTLKSGPSGIKAILRAARTGDDQKVMEAIIGGNRAGGSYVSGTWGTVGSESGSVAGSALGDSYDRLGGQTVATPGGGGGTTLASITIPGVGPVLTPNDIAGGISDIAGGAGDVVDAIPDALGQVANVLDGIAKFFVGLGELLLTPDGWKRLGKLLGGVALLLWGLNGLANVFTGTKPIEGAAKLAAVAAVVK